MILGSAFGFGPLGGSALGYVVESNPLLRRSNIELMAWPSGDPELEASRPKPELEASRPKPELEAWP